MSVAPDTSITLAKIIRHFAETPPEVLGVAVSGGSDSLGLLMLLCEWSGDGGPKLEVVTVDHGLRPEAAEEARHVADLCQEKGLSHSTLKWGGWEGAGNLQDQARRARYQLMENWAVSRGISDVALGHTADDQAETLLLRLARQSGLDGLAAMQARRKHANVTFHRPALNITRAALRDVLLARGISWIDDPSNEDTRFRRVRARHAMRALAPLGITIETLTAVAGHLAEARETIGAWAIERARDIVSFDAGDVLLDRAMFCESRADIQRRILQAALKWINGEAYSPRGRSIDQLLKDLGDGQGGTLQGCHITVTPRFYRITRELNAAESPRSSIDVPWDGRWHLTGQNAPDLQVGALGTEGLRQCPDRRETGVPDVSLLASPAVWQGDRLIAAPIAGLNNGWSAEMLRSEGDFFESLLSH